jgi:putative peptidoglycan lipid II flippase
VPALVGLGALQFSSLLDGVIATYTTLVGPTFLGFRYPLDEATNGILQYTQRLYQFPLGVFGVAVATAVFPAMSRAAGNPALFSDMLRRGLRLSLFIAVPASVGLALVGEDLARILFRGGNFSEDGVGRSAAILTGYAITVWAFAANQVLTRAFFAAGDVWTPVRAALICVALNIAGNVTLIWIPGVGEAGFGWSAAVAYTVQYALLTRWARTLAGGSPVFDAPTRRRSGATVLHAIAMGLVVAALLWILPGGDTIRLSVLRVAVCCSVGAGVYFALCRWARMPELGWLFSRGGG